MLELFCSMKVIKMFVAVFREEREKGLSEPTQAFSVVSKVVKHFWETYMDGKIPIMNPECHKSKH